MSFYNDFIPKYQKNERVIEWIEWAHNSDNYNTFKAAINGQKFC